MTEITNPALELVANIRVIVAPPVSLGQLNGLERRMVAITGGSVSGPHLNGTVLAGGSDIQTVRADGTIELVARYALDFGPHGKVLAENTGLRRAPVAAGGDQAANYFRGVFRFQAPEGALQWLNDSIFINTGYRDGEGVHIALFRVR
jgi:hypothetical protein